MNKFLIVLFAISSFAVAGCNGLCTAQDNAECAYCTQDTEGCRYERKIISPGSEPGECVPLTTAAKDNNIWHNVSDPTFCSNYTGRIDRIFCANNTCSKGLDEACGFIEGGSSIDYFGSDLHAWCKKGYYCSLAKPSLTEVSQKGVCKPIVQLDKMTCKEASDCDLARYLSAKYACNTNTTKCYLRSAVKDVQCTYDEECVGFFGSDGKPATCEGLVAGTMGQNLKNGRCSTCDSRSDCPGAATASITIGTVCVNDGDCFKPLYCDANKKCALYFSKADGAVAYSTRECQEGLYWDNKEDKCKTSTITSSGTSCLRYASGVKCQCTENSGGVLVEGLSTPVGCESAASTFHNCLKTASCINGGCVKCLKDEFEFLHCLAKIGEAEGFCSAERFPVPVDQSYVLQILGDMTGPDADRVLEDISAASSVTIDGHCFTAVLALALAVFTGTC